jgi:hypothetical protein
MNASFTRFRHYIINEVPTPLMDVEFTYDAKDKTVLIQCPDWLRYNPLSVPQPAVVEEKKPVSPPTKAVVKDGKEDVKGLLKQIAKDIPDANRKQRRAAVSAVARRM